MITGPEENTLNTRIVRQDAHILIIKVQGTVTNLIPNHPNVILNKMGAKLGHRGFSQNSNVGYP